MPEGYRAGEQVKRMTENGPAGIESGILENALVMIAVLERNGTILAWNRAAETITGYTKHEAVGSTTVWKKLYPQKKYRQEVTRRIAGILATKDYFLDFETSITTRSGEKKIILWNTKEVATREGTVVVAVGQDITKLRELGAFRESIVENANVLIAVIGPKGDILLWNRAAEEITGFLRTEVVGNAAIWKKIYPDPGYRREVTERITGIISSHRFFENLETKITTKTGRIKTISWNTRQIDGDGQHHAIAIGRDITEQKIAEEALIAYMTEMAMRIKQPVGIIRDNLRDVACLIRAGKITPEESAMMLDGQVRNATQVAANIQEFQKAIAEKNPAIPEAYRRFLEGD
jgi:PAS domain S-box-containing protein